MISIDPDNYLYRTRWKFLTWYSFVYEDLNILLQFNVLRPYNVRQVLTNEGIKVTFNRQFLRLIIYINFKDLYYSLCCSIRSYVPSILHQKRSFRYYIHKTKYFPFPLFKNRVSSHWPTRCSSFWNFSYPVFDLPIFFQHPNTFSLEPFP